MSIEDFIHRVQPRRTIDGVAAALLPFEPDGRIAVEAFQHHLQATHLAGLTNAVNMDTGYVNYLADEQKHHVLKWAREALGSAPPLIAGAYIEGQDGDAVARYRREMDRIAAHDATPIVFQTSQFHGLAAREKVARYREICKGFPAVLAFELSPVFAPNGELIDDDTFRGLMDIPELKGMKHSSLDRLLELRRLEVRDAHRPDFRIYTGNDLGIDMIEYGSDYLLGLATFAPEQFAERDRLWRDGDSRYYALSDALQNLGNVAFRPPVPAYKHSAAVFLNLCGRIPSPRTYPDNTQRPDWEAGAMRDCAARLGLA
ncbi:MAG TPA: dihydrodipicolinate synthase family protein [Terriglobia bacterium]|nr:dihydrodipicolinate synthase family protein [Terriglobia bacterium]